ncbi:MAG: hypothetical protein AB4372_16890 [Xenococcus sp. (in: cyanobacteria)]
MHKKQLATEIYRDLAIQIGKQYEVWEEPFEGEEGEKEWGDPGYDPQVVEKCLHESAKFALNAAEIFESEIEKNG